MVEPWIKIEIALQGDPRVRAMARDLRNVYVTQGRFSKDDAVFSVPFFVTTILGCLSRLWFHAYTYIRQDDTIDMPIDDIDEVVGVKGFSEIVTEDWLEILDAHAIKLPGFQRHNGISARRQALTTRRVARHREKVALESFNSEPSSNSTGVTDALPEKNRLDDLHTHMRAREDVPDPAPRGTVEIEKSRVVECVMTCKAVWPKGGAESWIQAEHAIRNSIRKGADPNLIESGTRKYSHYCHATGRIPQNPARWYADPNEPWTQEWTVPTADKAGAETKAKRDQAWTKARERAKALGFREPDRMETPEGYQTAMNQFELNRPRAAARSVAGMVAQATALVTK